MNKKTILVVLGISILGGLISGCAEKNVKKADNYDKNKATVIRIGYQPGHGQPIVSDELGFFKDEFEKDDVKVELKQFAAGPAIIEAFAAGELDFGFVGDQPAVQGRANNIDLKAVASYSASESGNGLIATNESGIKSIEDLKGKKIGYTVGSVGHQLLFKYLEKAGISKEEVELLNLSPADIYSSIISKKIDGAVTWEPYLGMVQKEGTAKLIAAGTGYKYNVNVIVGKEEFLKNNPELSSRLLKVFNKAVKWSSDNREETLNLIEKRSGIKKEVMRAGFEKFDQSLILDKKKIDSISDTIEYLKKNNTIREEVKIEDLIDTSYLKEAGIQ
ncbi:ABC transporter substrate-binding protein [Clostridium sp. LP20]|uniref:ABC transporter substrate-binding protein n=1 Tax=Clostridium sp. LP20 TaxID=3418665 RepID=UPI003EE81366